MNHVTATYIDFIQSIGIIVIFGIAFYAIKESLFGIRKVKVKIED